MPRTIHCPAGFTLIEDNHKTIIVRDDYKERLLQQGLDTPDVLIASDRKAPVAYSGRGETPSVPIAGTSEKMIIRKYRRGGFLRFLSRDIYWGGNRPFKELNVAATAHVRGIPTADVLAAVAVKVAGPLYRGYLISKEIPICRDLPYFFSTLAKKNSAGSVFKKKREVLSRAARAIRFMHDKGFYHGDLNLKNVLIDMDNTDSIYIIDWDKSTSQTKLSRSARRSNVLRFCRSMEKLRQFGLPLNKSDQLFFLKSYWSEEKTGKKTVRKDFVRMKLSLGMRKPRWKLEEMLGRK
jgi:3-deoxy-D-manno-octulosonic acid kinase